jgi:DNA-binding NtrC family response regulator/predicted hydrocarbon binding protein
MGERRKKKMLPDMASLVRLLSFKPEEGLISLGDRRMALFHADCLAALRRELIDSFGGEAARGLLTRMGYTSGALDAEMVRRVDEDRPLRDAFRAGPWLHMIEGKVIVELEKVEVDIERGHILVEATWKNSIEVDCHRMHYGPSAEPVCWMELGRACGWTTTFLGRPVLFREIECRGAGAKICRIVGRPIDEWGDDLEDLRYFQPEVFVNRGPRPPLPTTSKRSALDAPAAEPRPEMVGLSSGFNGASHLVGKVAGTKATVLFLGETGVGKELFARTLHEVSGREGPFVAVNCAAIPENLIEAELFGVEKGAYTGALASRAGRFERADGGTLFLDEVGTLTLAAQGKLLRVLQSAEIERVGDTRTRKIDVRVVAATNENLKERVGDGSFRGDLFYRLNVFPIRIPPLRDRRDDVPILMRSFLEKFARLHDKRITGFTERALRALLDYDFPGNIRELENMVERAVILTSDGSALDVFTLFSEGLPESTPRAPSRPESADLERSVVEAVRAKKLSVRDLERAVITDAVKESAGNVAAAARKIGLSRRQLAYRLRDGAA